MAGDDPTTPVDPFGEARRDARCFGCRPAPVVMWRRWMNGEPANPYAPPLGAAPAEPVQWEFETPPQAFERSDRRDAHPDVWRLLDLAEHGASEDERRSAVETLVSIFQQQVAEYKRGVIRRAILTP